jgi:hypothetical protein
MLSVMVPCQTDDVLTNGDPGLAVPHFCHRLTRGGHTSSDKLSQPSVRFPQVRILIQSKLPRHIVQDLQFCSVSSTHPEA